MLDVPSGLAGPGSLLPDEALAPSENDTPVRTVEEHLENDRTGSHHGPDREVERETIEALTSRS